MLMLRYISESRYTVRTEMRILIIEDDQKIAAAIKRGLERQHYAVDMVHDADDGLARATSGDYDLIILDRMLPGTTDGIGILKAMREATQHTPVLMLTAKSQILSRAEGLNAGADDYLVKPFAFVELIARVRALLRRPPQSLGTVLTYKDVTLDPENFVVRRGKQTIALTALEFALLEYFMRNPERTLSKEQLTQHVWDDDADILPNTVEVYIGYLRSKIDKPFPKQPLIHTKRGFGYYFGAAD